MFHSFLESILKSLKLLTVAQRKVTVSELLELQFIEDREERYEWLLGVKTEVKEMQLGNSKEVYSFEDISLDTLLDNEDLEAVKSLCQHFQLAFPDILKENLIESRPKHSTFKGTLFTKISSSTYLEHESIEEVSSSRECEQVKLFSAVSKEEDAIEDAHSTTL